ncbi:hypothetical protein GCM10011583_43930 [Streptomyces camponoticapitis]|uniref:Uncharacterized protein n=1 Tax=Streptomyces camponoticapitis TaxID=1616125 RepID=A0ABQ2EDC6_9ACTN|nr:hypothetical protein GCM10011583_43930 [Streptomyces camponoticapitis]
MEEPPEREGAAGGGLGAVTGTGSRLLSGAEPGTAATAGVGAVAGSTGFDGLRLGSDPLRSDVWSDPFRSVPLCPDPFRPADVCAAVLDPSA